MHLTRTGEYAVRTMMHLASAPYGTAVRIAAVSRAWDIPENFLRKIVQLLARSGLVTSQRGSGGGIMLSRCSDTISLLDVIEAVEGEIALNACAIGIPGCKRESWCAVHRVWCEARQSLRDNLSRRFLSDLAAASAASRGADEMPARSAR